MNIVVLAGGLSTERDVSFATGNVVSNALRMKGHKVVLLDVFLGYSDKPEDLTGIFDRSEAVSVKISNEIKSQAPIPAEIRAMRKDQSDCFFGPNVIELCKMADIVFMGLHGEDGENGKVQATFDLFGIKYTGSGYVSCALAMDKGLSKGLFLKNGIPTPEGIILKKEDYSQEIETLSVKTPCVVKPCCGGSSIGVSIVATQKELDRALTQAFQYESKVIVEEYIQGREFSVGVINYNALPVIEIAPLTGFYNYENKYKAGSAVETCPAILPKGISWEMQHYAREVALALNIETYARMDFILDNKGDIYCLEANTLPGMTKTSLLPQEAKASGMDIEELCEEIIKISFNKYG
ncbi:D-alanine--D-alanine ligase [Lachnospiraceae bacterium ZAX-1]